MTAIRAIHASRRQLGLDEEDARDLYERVTGKRSLRAMSVGERNAIVKEMRGRGAASNGYRKPLEGRFAKKLQALWIACWNLGITNKRDDVALLAFVKRQTGIEHTRFLHHKEDADKVIEALKGWMARKAHINWSNVHVAETWKCAEGYKIAWAQWVLIEQDKSMESHDDFLAFVSLHRDGPNATLEDNSDWIPVMNALGRKIREAKN